MTGDGSRDDFVDETVDTRSESSSLSSLFVGFGNMIADIEGGRPGLVCSCCFRRIKRPSACFNKGSKGTFNDRSLICYETNRKVLSFHFYRLIELFTFKISQQPNFDSIIADFCEISIAKQTNNSKFSHKLSVQRTSHTYITSSNEHSRLKQINIHRKKKYILLELFSARNKQTNKQNQE